MRVGRAFGYGTFLTEAGADVTPDTQVAFFSSDEIEVEGEKGRFGVSIPMAKAMSDEVLLAWAMDGEALRPEHGFPVRAVVPGYAGVRSAKWVTDIRVQDTAAESPIQRKDYKLFPPNVTKEEVDWDAGLTIDAMPVNSAICEPAPGARLESGPLTLRGWATASERAIRRVDVSTDGGRNWSQAEASAGPGSSLCLDVMEVRHGTGEGRARAGRSGLRRSHASPAGRARRRLELRRLPGDASASDPHRRSLEVRGEACGCREQSGQ